MSQASEREDFNALPQDNDRRSVRSSPTFLSSPLSSLHSRPGYHRVGSDQEEDTAYGGADRQDLAELPENDSVHGLRIRFTDHDHEALRFGATVQSPPEPQAGIAESLLSPNSVRSSKHGRNASTASLPNDYVSSMGRSSPSMSRLDAPFSADPEDHLLRPQRSMSTLKSFDTSGELDPRIGLCRSRAPKSNNLHDFGADVDVYSSPRRRTAVQDKTTFSSF